MKSVNPPVAGTLASASLTTRFALYSFLCIGIMTVALWFLVSNYLINQILEHEWQTTAQIVRADVRKFLEAYDFKAQDRKSVGPKFAALLGAYAASAGYCSIQGLQSESGRPVGGQ